MGIGELLVVILLDKVGVDGFSNVQVRGVPDKVFKFRTEAHIIAGREAKPGTDEVVVGKAIRGRFKNIELGQSFDLKNGPFNVVGVFETGGSSFESEVWADSTRCALPSGATAWCQRSARLDSPSKFDGFKACDPRRTASSTCRRCASPSTTRKNRQGIGIMIAARRAHHLLLWHRRDHRSGHHHARRGRQPPKGDRHPARPRVFALLHHLLVPPRVDHPCVGRCGGGRCLRAHLGFVKFR